jgi:23S rRNA (guanine2445-N2)-methyltransferase / 23S rRNA (guanine2069-N7)-methyltransferase
MRQAPEAALRYFRALLARMAESLIKKYNIKNIGSMSGRCDVQTEIAERNDKHNKAKIMVNAIQHRLVASCAAGLEELVQKEAASFGGLDITVSKGVVAWQGTLESGYRACLWSRFASRIFLQLGQFEMGDEEALYIGSKSIPWDAHLDLETTFAVDCTLSGEAAVSHSRFAALRLKDGLVDSFREQVGERPSVDADRPGIRIHLHIEDKLATVSLDLSGESLHRRGYRVTGCTAPLKETLAAALVALSGWQDAGIPPTLIDPMCGTGTLLIEAALMFGDSAPGLSRSYFGFMGWKQHDAGLWETLVEEAISREEAGLSGKWPLFLGYDADPKVVAAARKNIEKAGLADYIRVKQAELARLQPPSGSGLLLSNLPYGERLSETEEVAYLYRAFGRIVRQRFSGWKVGVFISNPDLTDTFGLSWNDKIRLYNGSLLCRLLLGSAPENQEIPFRWKPTIIPGDSEFANRLGKNLKKFLKWSEKEGITCFRVYDRDLPEYNISVDLYGKWVHVQEFAPPKTIDAELASARFSLALHDIREILGVKRERIFIKTRQRQKGNEQYQQKDSRKKMYEVREGECYFLVNFTDYLDTGLFLDHRPVRMQIAREASGKKFLNLFGYSGAATVHAAMGGAQATTTVDLSANYLHWTRMNLALNGLGDFSHSTVKADCLQWLQDNQEKFDLIFVDPPTFSNTKKEHRVFDIQRDHVRLINLAMERLEHGGKLFFSTNFRTFSLDDTIRNSFAVRDMTRESIPFDFSRNQRIHQCWELHKK